MIDKFFRDVAVVLAFTTVLATTTVFAADLANSGPVLGALSGAGSVQVRGVALQKETTLFSGDRVRTGPGAYVKLSLANGARIEAAGDTDFVLKRDGEKGIRLSLTAGSIAFSASKDPLTVAINGQEVHAQSGARAQIALLPGTELADVRVISGNVDLKNITTKGTVAMAKGSERVVNLKTGAVDMPVSMIASVAPSALPAGIPPAASPASSAIDSVLGLVGAGAGGAATAAAAAVSSDSSSNSNGKGNGNDKDKTAGLVYTINQALAAANQVISAANLIATSKPAKAAQANAILAATNATKAQLLALNAQIPSLVQQNDIAHMKNSINDAVDALNSEIAQIKSLAQQAGVTIPSIQDVDKAKFASPS